MRRRRGFRAEIDEGRLQLHNAAMERLPLPDASVDAMVSTNTIYFVNDLSAGFAELAGVLRPSGRLALGVGDPQSMTRTPFTKYGFKLRPVSEVIDELNRAGLSLVEARRIGDGPQAFHVLVAERAPA